MRALDPASLSGTAVRLADRHMVAVLGTGSPAQRSTTARHGAFCLVVRGPLDAGRGATNGGIIRRRRAVPQARGTRRSLHETKPPLESVDSCREIGKPPARRAQRLRHPRVNVDQLRARRPVPRLLRDGLQQGAAADREEYDELLGLRREPRSPPLRSPLGDRCGRSRGDRRRQRCRGDRRWRRGDRHCRQRRWERYALDSRPDAPQVAREKCRQDAPRGLALLVRADVAPDADLRRNVRRTARSALRVVVGVKDIATTAKAEIGTVAVEVEEQPLMGGNVMNVL
jgi:hypothetical protein